MTTDTERAEMLRDVQHLLDQLTKEPMVEHVLLVSGDGLVVAHDSDTDKSIADRYAAAASGLYSVAHGATREPVRQVVAELHLHTLFVISCGARTRLMVVAAREIDTEALAERMAHIDKTVRHHTSTEARPQPTIA